MFCQKCGKPVPDRSAFCPSCGAPQGAGDTASVRKASSGKTVRAVVSVIAVLIVAAVVPFALFSANKLSGKYGNGTRYNGDYYYILEFKTNDTCLWTQDGSTFSGTYEYLDGEYIINIKGNGYYLSTTFRAEKRGDSLYLSGGVFRDSEFIKIE